MTFAQEENGKIEREANTETAEIETTYNVEEPIDNDNVLEDTTESEDTKQENVFNNNLEEDQGEDEIKADSHLAIIESNIEADFVDTPIVENGIET